MSSPLSEQAYSSAALLTADYCRTMPDGSFAAVWLVNNPSGDGEFVVSTATASEATLKEGSLPFYLNGIRHLERFQTHTPMGAVLGLLGISADIHVNNLQSGRAVGRMTFAPVSEIIDRAADFNLTLPDQHKIPTLELWRGSTIPETEFIESFRNDTFLLADGTGDYNGPLITGHDLSYHLASRLSKDRGSRKVVGSLASAVLKLPLDDIFPVEEINKGPDGEDITIGSFFTSLFDQVGSPTLLEPKDFADVPGPILQPAVRDVIRGRRGTSDMLYFLTEIASLYDKAPGRATIDFTPPTKAERIALAQASRDHVAILGHYARRALAKTG